MLSAKLVIWSYDIRHLSHLSILKYELNTSTPNEYFQNLIKKDLARLYILKI